MVYQNSNEHAVIFENLEAVQKQKQKAQLQIYIK